MSKSRSLGRGTNIHKIELEPVATPSWRLAATASSGAGQRAEMVAFLKEGSGRRCQLKTSVVCISMKLSLLHLLISNVYSWETPLSSGAHSHETSTPCINHE